MEKYKIEELREILENVNQPEMLDDHPWLQRAGFREVLDLHPEWATLGSGMQLLLALSERFCELLPPTPPVEGKRLDTRWGRFGILAALYFAPLVFGKKQPASMRDAWRTIDASIALFQFGQSAFNLPEAHTRPYELIGNSYDLPPNSTISDWHRGGLENLLDLLNVHEARLDRQQQIQSAHPDSAPVKIPDPSPSSYVPWVRWSTRLLGLGILLWLSFHLYQGYQILQLALELRSELGGLADLNVQDMNSSEVSAAADTIRVLNQKTGLLYERSKPYQPILDRLGWMPVYGGDLSQAPELLALSAHMLNGLDIAWQNLKPLYESIVEDDTTITGAEIIEYVIEVRPGLEMAKKEFDEASRIRDMLELESFTSEVRGSVTQFDAGFEQIDEYLSISLELPNMLGAGDDGPKTYLILVQNEDELRPTGGFLTAVGRLVLYQGQVMNWEVSDSYSVDDKSKIYPVAPWQLQRFMNLPALMFRDSNWWPDFPTSAGWAEYLYAYKHASSVDGVIAIDQQVIQQLLDATGPLYVPELSRTVTAENVFEVMRSEKIPPPDYGPSSSWDRKQFLKPIAERLIERFKEEPGVVNWETLLPVLSSLLDEGHILLQLDNPVMTSLLVKRGWDGALDYTGGDYLMVVDSNVGYNKTNAVVERSLDYDVNLRGPSGMIATLMVTHSNRAVGGDQGCGQFDKSSYQLAYENYYAINQCYYNYLRIYRPLAVSLLSSKTHSVTREEMIMLDRDQPAQVDLLNELIPGISGFGTLHVVPKNSRQHNEFTFALPESIIDSDLENGNKIYRLAIKKQPGVTNMRVVVRIHLPNRAEIISIPPDMQYSDGDLLLDMELRKGRIIEVVYR